MQLTGDDLKAKLSALGQTDENSAAIACGYVTKAGKASLAAFRHARLEAHGLALGAPKATTGRKGKPLSFTVTTGKTGNIVMAGGYSALLGIAPGGQVAISHQGDALILTAATGTSNAAPVALDAMPVVTYDSPRELVAA